MRPTLAVKLPSSPPPKLPPQSQHHRREESGTPLSVVCCSTPGRPRRPFSKSLVADCRPRRANETRRQSRAQRSHHHQHLPCCWTARDYCSLLHCDGHASNSDERTISTWGKKWWSWTLLPLPRSSWPMP